MEENVGKLSKLLRLIARRIVGIFVEIEVCDNLHERPILGCFIRLLTDSRHHGATIDAAFPTDSLTVPRPHFRGSPHTNATRFSCFHSFYYTNDWKREVGRAGQVMKG